MNKIDLHLHLTLNQLPRQNNIFISSAENMIPHLESLGIQKGVLMSGGEKQSPIGSNEENKAICDKYPKYFSDQWCIRPTSLWNLCAVLPQTEFSRRPHRR